MERKKSKQGFYISLCVCVFFRVSQEAVWFLSNITAGNQAQVQVKISQVCLSPCFARSGWDGT